MRKCTAVLIVLALVFATTSCGHSEKHNRKNALRICIDTTYSLSEERKEAYLDDFLFSLKECGGLGNIVLDVIPASGAERDTTITRIRTELMSGGGPDVFIVDCPTNTDYTEALFPYPEKVLENGLFLPLDMFMENNTEFTEWDKMQQVVLAAGQNEEGQQIIPLSYTFPVRTCQVADFSLEMPEQPISWQDTLTEPALAAIYAPLNDCIELVYGRQADGDFGSVAVYYRYLEYVLGKLVDFEEEELLFTEEELLQRINEILVLQENAVYEENSIFNEQFMGSTVVNDSSIPVTMIPMYSDDGGIAVSIRNFAAVNRNTKHPEEAYRVIDVLLREHQLSKPIYTDVLCAAGSIFESVPLNDAAFHKNTPIKQCFFSDESYQRFVQVKEQITAANYQNALSDDLYTLLMSCKNPQLYDSTIEELVCEAYENMQRKVRE